jgi:hypothetical protein
LSINQVLGIAAPAETANGVIHADEAETETAETETAPSAEPAAVAGDGAS